MNKFILPVYITIWKKNEEGDERVLQKYIYVY